MMKMLLNFQKVKKITNPETYISYKTTCDFDNDGIKESIYTITNASLEVVSYDIHSYIFMVKKGKIIPIADSKSDPYTVMEIINLDKDDEYEMIVNKGDVDMKTFESCYLLYDLKDEKWVLKKDCK